MGVNRETMNIQETIAHCANILNVPNINDTEEGLTTEVSVFNLKAMLEEAYQEGLVNGLTRAVEIYDEEE